jgi:hypothetical protein
MNNSLFPSGFPTLCLGRNVPAKEMSGIVHICGTERLLQLPVGNRFAEAVDGLALNKHLSRPVLKSFPTGASRTEDRDQHHERGSDIAPNIDSGCRRKSQNCEGKER